MLLKPRMCLPGVPYPIILSDYNREVTSFGEQDYQQYHNSMRPSRFFAKLFFPFTYVPLHFFKRCATDAESPPEWMIHGNYQENH